MVVQIELSDQQAAALQAKAAAQGLTLQAWIQRQAGFETNRPSTKPLETGYGMLAKYGPAPSAEEIDENRRDMFRGFAESC
jgi:hypothetical protein